MQLAYKEWRNNKVLLYSTGHYIQYPVINHEKEQERERVYMHIYVCVCITESLCYTAVVNIAIQLYFNRKTTTTTTTVSLRGNSVYSAFLSFHHTCPANLAPCRKHLPLVFFHPSIRVPRVPGQSYKIGPSDFFITSCLSTLTRPLVSDGNAFCSSSQLSVILHVS